MTNKRIIVSNAKGGCGKTTIATNLASHYASCGKNVRIFDHDPQCSTLHWLQQRSDKIQQIHGVDASRGPHKQMTRSWQMRVPPETDVVIIDTAAGFDIHELAAMLTSQDFLIIPVLPSPIDIHATAHFIKDILLIGKARQKQIRMAVVANRVRYNTLMYHALERFLFTLNIPFVTSLRDTQNYSKAIQQGIGIQELNTSRIRKDREQWAPLVRWLDTPLAINHAEVRPLFEKSS